MKPLLGSWLLLLLASLNAQAQYIPLNNGEYMDTTSTRNPACAHAPFMPYFSVGGKYPRSSETLVAEATAFLRRKNQRYSGSGYVTFRFVVDCAGFRQPMTQVLQTDANYQTTHFRRELVEELYAFLLTLKDWRTVPTASGTLANYFTYLSFKISNGKIVAVIP